MEWITSSNTAQEAWRRLLEYANLELAEAAISARHGQADEKARKNYRKQTAQMRVALLQAREYFEATSHSSLYTSPNHLYYGMMSLASGAMLLNGTGTSSFDYLRRDRKNLSHGLHFSTGIDANRAVHGADLLADSYIEILEHGHFRNWYSVLPNAELALAKVVERFDDGGTFVTNKPIGGEPLVEVTKLIKSKFTILEMMKRLPDLYTDLVRAGIPVAASRVSHDVTFSPTGIRSDVWRLHGATTSANLDNILNAFRFSSELVPYVNAHIYPSGLAAVISMQPPFNSTRGFSWPSSRERLDNEQFAYADQLNTTEFADYYIAAFGLSMLARYYPDLWVSAIEAHGRTSKIVEGFIEIGMQKVPLLALRLLAGPITISAHKPPWYL